VRCECSPRLHHPSPPSPSPQRPAFHHRSLDDLAARPLVLVFTGPTGTGKSETARTVGSALLASRIPLEGAPGGAGGATVPEGYIELRGEDFLDRSNVTALQEKMRDSIAGALYRCRGHVVLVVDEAQKAAREALAVLGPLLQGRHARVAHPDLDEPLDATRMVIILISDIGIPEIEEYVQAEASALAALSSTANAAAAALPPAAAGRAPSAASLDVGLLQRRLSAQMRARISEEFRPRVVDPGSPPVGLDLGGLVDSVITFFPFNHTGAASLLEKGLEDLGRMPGIRAYIDGLEWSPEVPSLLALPRFLKYNTEDAAGKAGGNRCAIDMRRLAEARRAAPKVPVSSVAKVSADGQVVADDGSAAAADYSPAGERHGDATTPLVCGDVCEMPRSCIARYGGREILHHRDRSPLQKLAQRLRQEIRRFPKRGASSQGGARGGGGEGGGGGGGAKGSAVDGSSATGLSGLTEWMSRTFSSSSSGSGPSADGAKGGHPGSGAVVEARRDGETVLVRVEVLCGLDPPDGTCRLPGVGFRFLRCVRTRLPREVGEDGRLEEEGEVREECRALYEGDL
jgi:hypothetical protein